ncbi:hypothetical protein JCM15519_20940 [Fundidesulfovibrio butyratiphilus]
MHAMEAFLERVEGACADVSVDNSKRRECEGGGPRAGRLNVNVARLVEPGKA